NALSRENACCKGQFLAPALPNPAMLNWQRSNCPDDPMPSLHPQFQEVLKIMAEAGLRPIEAMTPAEAREQMEATARACKAEPLPVARVEERAMPGPSGPIRLRLYWPNALSSGGPLPTIVYYHGGGHVIGSLDTHDLSARN